MGKEDRFILTPLGFFIASLGEPEGTKLFKQLKTYVKKLVKNEDEIGALIFKNKGGHFVSVRKVKKKK